MTLKLPYQNLLVVGKIEKLISYQKLSETLIRR